MSACCAGPSYCTAKPARAFHRTNRRRKIIMGTSKNSRPLCRRMISVSFPFSFIGVHAWAVCNRQRKQFFEVPSSQVACTPEANSPRRGKG